jgi:hypothetical protein
MLVLSLERAFWPVVVSATPAKFLTGHTDYSGFNIARTGSSGRVWVANPREETMSLSSRLKKSILRSERLPVGREQLAVRFF